MAGLKEIERRLASVKNTKKITYAMKLVSAAKLRKAQDAVGNARGYTDAVNILLNKLLEGRDKDKVLHPLMEERPEVKKVGVLVVGGARGLCGGFNTNLNKRMAEFYSTQGKSAEVDAVVLGKKPAEFFRRVKLAYSSSYEKLPEDANVWPFEEICTHLETRFLAGNIDQLYVAYTKFKSALSVEVRVEQLLPFSLGEVALELQVEPSPDSLQVGGKVIFEPSTDEVFSAIIPRVFRAKVRQACLESKASEHGSRMAAMDAATKNAGDLINRLRLTYNKLRQSGITSELLDIIGGAEALN